MSASDADPFQQSAGYDWTYLRKGAARIRSVPALILLSAFVGFGALAREAGLPLGQLAFLVPSIWALPSHLIVLAGIVSDAPLLIVASSVALASVRMLPMTMALVPVLRIGGTRWWHLALVSNMVAITAWVHTLERAADLPRRGRLPYFVGFAGTMMVSTTLVACATHAQSAALPLTVMAAFYFLTPLYFATSVWKSATVDAERVSLVVGFVAAPAVFAVLPQTGLLLAGCLAGAIGFAAWLLGWRR